VASDSLVLGGSQQPRGSGAREVLNTNGWWSGIQTFAQGAARGLALGVRTIARGGALVAVADVMDGNKAAIARGVERLSTRVAAAAGRALPAQADLITRVANPLIRAGGATLRFVARVAPFLNVAAAGWDTYKAATETDATKRPGAWANAGLSIGSAVLAVGAVVVGATPLGWAAGITAAGVAGFQLADTLIAGGAWTAAIGRGVGNLFG